MEQQIQDQSKSFYATALIKIDAKLAFVKVEVIEDRQFMKDYNVTSQEEYEAAVHYVIHRDSQVLQALSHGIMPTDLIFGTKDAPEGAKVFDLSTAARRTVHLCMRPCDGPGSHCCIWFDDSEPPENA